MTSRDFRAIAAIIARTEATDTVGRGILAREFADYLARLNPRFDRSRFLAAAMGDPIHKGDAPRQRDYARS